MAVLKMQRITICALKKNRKAILEKLQSLGVLEVNHILDEDEDFRKMDTAERKTGFEKAAAAVDQALDILEQYAPEKKSMFSALEGKKLISADEEMKVQEERRDLLRIARQIYDLDREHAEQQAAVSRLMNSIESLTPWLGLDVPLKTTETERTVFFPGVMPGGTTAGRIYEILKEKVPDAAGADVHIVFQDQSTVYLGVVCMKEDAGAVEEALRSEGFARPAQVWDETPAAEKADLEAEAAIVAVVAGILHLHGIKADGRVAEIAGHFKADSFLTQQILFHFQLELCIIFGPIKSGAQCPRQPFQRTHLPTPIHEAGPAGIADTSLHRKALILKVVHRTQVTSPTAIIK